MMPRIPFRILVLATLIAGLSAQQSKADTPAPTPEQARFFETKIRPILVEHCAKCHGETKQKAGLRLDNRASILEGGDTGPAVVPRDLEESLLLTAISHEDDTLKMPPSKKLPREAIDNLTEWVKMGAPWPGSTEDVAAAPKKAGFSIGDKERAHWAFQPVKRPAPPAVKNEAWAVNPIDQFLLAGLEAKGLTPNPDASRQALIRRAYYDLTGLPPTPAEVEAFVADPSPSAYKDLIDRLLDSPRYGEKWGRHWLDLVRFAETNSYERDNAKPNAWRYRDYVINAFNRDQPYDRFIREQLAGDEIPGAGARGIIATGFYRLGIWDDEPTDIEQAFYDGIDDLVATTGQVFLGLTIDCARCHDHKLDPIPQKDYYRFVSFFRNTNYYRNGGQTDERPLLETDEAKQEYAQKLEARKRHLNRLQDRITAAELEVKTQLRQERGSQWGTDLHADLDALRYRFYRDTWDQLPEFDAMKPEGRGVIGRPAFSLEPRTRNVSFGFVFEGALVVPQDGAYTFYLDADDGARLKVGDQVVIEYDGLHELGSERKQVIELTKGRWPIRLDYFQREEHHGLNVAWEGPGFSRRKLSESSSDSDSAEVTLAQVMATEAERILGADRARVYRELKQSLRKLEAAVIPIPKALCISEAGPKSPETFVLLRGNPHTKGDPVEPAFLEVLGGVKAEIPAPGPDAKSSGRRLALANWIASSENPLTSRVMANRVWQYHFGRGIVRSSNNLGLQGDAPTHPELLDWLAAELVEGGWKLKRLHRLIMTSRAYRMGSANNEQAAKVDPANDLFWRFEMRRLTGEEIRDSILAVTGQLNLKMFGPGVYPEIPPEVMAGQSKPGYGWGKSSPEEQARRSIYIHVKRSLLTPLIESFDMAETDRSSPVRFTTTQPTQALAMINGDFLNQQAELLAARLTREAGESSTQRVTLALRLITARVPSGEEVARGTRLIERLQDQHGIEPAQALKAFCLVALNLNEFIYLD